MRLCNPIMGHGAKLTIIYHTNPDIFLLQGFFELITGQRKVASQFKKDDVGFDRIQVDLNAWDAGQTFSQAAGVAVVFV